MKPDKNPGSKRGGAEGGKRLVPTPGAGARRPLSAQTGWAIAFGLFLGLAIVKFGNPAILDYAVSPPEDLSQVWSYAWPARWAYWLLIPLALIGFGVAVASKPRWPASNWLWRLPLAWFAWQLVAATQSVDGRLSAMTLWQFGGCLACYFLGALALGNRSALRWLLIGVLAAFTFCLVRAVNQKLFEFPAEHRALLEGERTSWTNCPPEFILELKRDGTIITTNGVDIANPVILTKYARGRVMGTLVYPNALAGVVLLLFPVSIGLAFRGAQGSNALANRIIAISFSGYFIPKATLFFFPNAPPAMVLLLMLITVVLVYYGTRRSERFTRLTVITWTLFLGSAALFWTGSKLGWLMAMAMAGVWLFHFNWPRLWKAAALVLVLGLGAGVFAVRFQNYFAAGAKSVGARFDYWCAAVQNTAAHPVVGSGPGTFQHAYAALKAPEAEMARLTHNDYLEQFSDSGLVGGITYAAWIFLALAASCRRVWQSGDAVIFALFLGVLGWFAQGLGEFSLYVPALAWTAFTLLGWLAADSQASQMPAAAGAATRRPASKVSKVDGPGGS
jgi:hypothetical protein